ncbi:MAG: hypothetical protein ACE14M_10045 [Terriglobales bacterium]
MFYSDQKRYKSPAPQEQESHFAMLKNRKLDNEFYSEAEAAEALGISVPRLYMLLDEHIFNDGNPRPEGLTFTSSELLLLGFWHRSTPNPKVVRMPRRA